MRRRGGEIAPPHRQQAPDPREPGMLDRSPFEQAAGPLEVEPLGRDPRPVVDRLGVRSGQRGQRGLGLIQSFEPHVQLRQRQPAPAILRVGRQGPREVLPDCRVPDHRAAHRPEEHVVVVQRRQEGQGTEPRLHLGAAELRPVNVDQLAVRLDGPRIQPDRLLQEALGRREPPPLALELAGDQPGLVGHRVGVHCVVLKLQRAAPSPEPRSPDRVRRRRPGSSRGGGP